MRNVEMSYVVAFSGEQENLNRLMDDIHHVEYSSNIRRAFQCLKNYRMIQAISDGFRGIMRKPYGFDARFCCEESISMEDSCSTLEKAYGVNCIDCVVMA